MFHTGLKTQRAAGPILFTAYFNPCEPSRGQGTTCSGHGPSQSNMLGCRSFGPFAAYFIEAPA